MKEKTLFIRINEDEREKALARIERDKKSGKLSDSETLSSVIRGLIRNWLRKP